MKVFLGVITIGLAYILWGIYLGSYLWEAFYPYVFLLSLITTLFFGHFITKKFKRLFWAWLVFSIVPGLLIMLYLSTRHPSGLLMIPDDILWWELIIPSSIIIPQILLLLYAITDPNKKGINTANNQEDH